MGTTICRSQREPDEGLLEEGPCDENGCDGWLERDKLLSTEWRYVGEGRGSFDKVHQYSFVGEGRGSHKGDEHTTYHGWRLGTISSALVVILASAGGVLLLWQVLTSASEVESEASLRARRSGPAMALGNLSAGDGSSIYNCSYHYFEQPWTEAKAAWCCLREGAGCPSTSPDRLPRTTWMLVPVPLPLDGSTPTLPAGPAPVRPLQPAPTRSPPAKPAAAQAREDVEGDKAAAAAPPPPAKPAASRIGRPAADEQREEARDEEGEEGDEAAVAQPPPAKPAAARAEMRPTADERLEEEREEEKETGAEEEAADQAEAKKVETNAAQSSAEAPASRQGAQAETGLEGAGRRRLTS